MTSLSLSRPLTLGRLRFRLWAGLILLNLLVLGLGSYSLWRDRQQYEQRVVVSTQNTARLLEHDINALFSRIDSTLHSMADELQEQFGQGVLNRKRIEAFLQLHHRHLPDVISLRMTDASGRVIFGESVVPGAVDLSDRAFFLTHRDNPEAGLVVGKPVEARISKVWSIPVSRRISKPDGSFAGIIYANLPVESLVSMFSGLDLGANGVVVLRNLGYELMARHPVLPAANVGLGQVAVSKELVALLSAGRSHGTYQSVAPTDRVVRTHTFHRLAGVPMYVVVGQAPQDYLGDWYRNVIETLALMVCVLLTSAGLAWMLLRGWRRQLALGESLRISEQRWSLALASGEFCVWDWDTRSGKVHLSMRGKQMFGYAEEEIGDGILAWNALLHPDDRRHVHGYLRKLLRGQMQGGAVEYRARHKDGHWMWVLTRGMVAERNAQGRVVRLVGTHVDLTERRMREDDLRLAATVFNIADEAMVVTSPENKIITVNPAFTVITGYAAAEVVGRNPSMLSAKTHGKAFYQEMWNSLLNTGGWAGEVLNRRKNGEVYVEWLSIKRVLDAQGRLTHHVAVFSDITARKATESRIRHLALHDALTNLPNRALLSERLEQAMVRARRDQKRLGLMYFDLDKFKPINDSYGHEVGDLLLKAVASRVLACVRESDTVARIGGDEFVVLLPGLDSEQDALGVAEKIRLALVKPFNLAGHELGISTSIGLAIHPEHGEDAQALTAHADAAMYHAKNTGRDRIALYRPGM